MDTFTLSRNFRNFCFDNPEKINPWHSAIFFFAIEHCNRLWWKEKFWFPSQMVMEAVWIRNWKTYKKYLDDLVEWGFIEMIEKSKNQYSSNIIALVKNTKAPTKALDKALSKHNTKQVQSIASINIQDNKEQDNKEQELENFLKKWNEIFWKNYMLTEDLKRAFKTCRNKYTLEQIQIWASTYYKDKVSKWSKEERKQFELHILKFLTQKNWLPNYL